MPIFRIGKRPDSQLWKKPQQRPRRNAIINANVKHHQKMYLMADLDSPVRSLNNKRKFKERSQNRQET